MQKIIYYKLYVTYKIYQSILYVPVQCNSLDTALNQFISNVIHVYTTTYPRFLLSFLIFIYCMCHSVCLLVF